ncbi:MAG: hypothetical protein K2K90_05455 [Lachnospiraceae bacterium]|nr:hypothetical protein [Lachnospiraceae bacterium]
MTDIDKIRVIQLYEPLNGRELDSWCQYFEEVIAKITSMWTKRISYRDGVKMMNA